MLEHGNVSASTSTTEKYEDPLGRFHAVGHLGILSIGLAEKQIYFELKLIFYYILSIPKYKNSRKSLAFVDMSQG